jgi:archaellum biogenesis ATPase FlaH
LLEGRAALIAGPLGDRGVHTIVAGTLELSNVWLIVLDTPEQLTGGDLSPSGLRQFLSRCDDIRRQTSAAILLVHNDATDPSASYALRAACDTVLQVETGPGGARLIIEEARETASKVLAQP